MQNLKFHQKVIRSIRDPLFIAQSTKHKTNGVVLYILLLIVIVSLASGIIRGIGFTRETNHLIEVVKSPDFPEFSIKDGRFSIDSDDPIIIEMGTELIVIIDTTGASDINDLVGYSTGYLLTEEVFTITMAGQSPAYYRLDLFKGFEFNKEIFIEQLRIFANVGLFVVPLVYVIFMLFTNFFRSLLLLVLAHILRRLMVIERIRGSEIYKMVLCSMTVGVLLYETMMLIPVFLPMPFNSGILVSLAPMVLFYIPSATVLSRGMRMYKVEEEAKRLKHDNQKHDSENDE